MPRGKNLRPEAADRHRFGDPDGGDPRKATKMGPPKWSIRKQLAYMAQNVDPNDKNAIRKLLGNNPTLAQVIAMADDRPNCRLTGTSRSLRSSPEVKKTVKGPRRQIAPKLLSQIILKTRVPQK